jgi:hypothetical protein
MESHLNGERELANAALVQLARRSVENNKEGEEQRVEARIADQPALVCGAFRPSFPASRAAFPREEFRLALQRGSRGV